MADIVSRELRSEIMSRIGSKDTKPEMIVRKLAHSLGFRFRLHRKDLPGRPDLAFPGKKKVIFVNGCFWHGHEACRRGKPPKSNRLYWYEKIQKNKERDKSNISSLKEHGWGVLTIWECETKDLKSLEKTLLRFLTETS